VAGGDKVFARRIGSVALALAASIALVACGSSSSSASKPKGSTTTTAAKATGAITVSAAASLTEAFTKIGKDFSAANPGATVTFNFGSSGTLATQIQQGAPADAFASADPANITTLQQAGLVDDRATVIAKNKLVIVTKPGNPKHVKTLADLATVGIVSLCGETVPCGKYADQALTTAGVTIPADTITRGADVKATLGAVTTGDADAAIVYVTDAKTAGSAVAAVTIPAAQNVIATYPIAVLKASGNPTTARAFVQYVASKAGQSTLASYGFLPPS
jgi:molybdate transport system substrate-binding protein